MEHQTLGRRFVCPIGPATKREFILDWRILQLPWQWGVCDVYLLVLSSWKVNIRPSKHCPKPHCRTGVVGTFRPCLGQQLYTSSVARSVRLQCSRKDENQHQSPILELQLLSRHWALKISVHSKFCWQSKVMQDSI